MSCIANYVCIVYLKLFADDRHLFSNNAEGTSASLQINSDSVVRVGTMESEPGGDGASFSDKI